jgi:hypothetical protein
MTGQMVDAPIHAQTVSFQCSTLGIWTVNARAGSSFPWQDRGLSRVLGGLFQDGDPCHYRRGIVAESTGG